MKKYCESLAYYTRFNTHKVKVGNLTIGGSEPIVVQSMTDTDTNDTAACLGQIEQLVEAGCQMVRLTAQGKREAKNLKHIVEGCKERGLDVAIVADVHFTPEAAIVAAEYVDKVRVNPGNFRNDKGQFEELLAKCKERGVALRIGVNHGSLSERMVQKWGDTPKGMVESAMEYLKLCQKAEFDQVVISMKSSNVRVMVQAYRALVAEMIKREMSYPLHLGVTEAGDGAEGRIKSAVGIGALLADGIGDTIRVSLTEAPQNEIPVARAIADYFAERENQHEADDFIEPISEKHKYKPYKFSPRKSKAVGNIGGDNLPLHYGELDEEAKNGILNQEVAILTAFTSNPTAEWRATLLHMMDINDRRPAILHRQYREDSIEQLRIKVAADFGMLFIDGLAQGLWIENQPLSDESDITLEGLDELALVVFQAARVRMSATEYIACPGCGRTLFDLQSTLAAIKKETSHLKHLKIGVMGCIVNGPGEMADADYGYVGEGKGKISLYKGQSVVKRAIPESKAVEALIEVIKENGDWVEPTAEAEVEGVE